VCVGYFGQRLAGQAGALLDPRPRCMETEKGKQDRQDNDHIGRGRGAGEEG